MHHTTVRTYSIGLMWCFDCILFSPSAIICHKYVIIIYINKIYFTIINFLFLDYNNDYLNIHLVHNIIKIMINCYEHTLCLRTHIHYFIKKKTVMEQKSKKKIYISNS